MSYSAYSSVEYVVDVLDCVINIGSCIIADVLAHVG